MKRMSPEAKVGLLVLAGLLILVYMSLKVGKLSLGPGGGYVLRLELDNAVGLVREGEVLVAGIPVGVVEDIRLDHGKALLLLRINSGVKLPVDSVASLRTRGVLGERYVAIEPGTSSKDLADGDTIRAGPPPGDLDRLVSKLNDISTDVQRVTKNLAKVLGTAEGEQSMRETLEGVRGAAVGLRQVIEENREGIRSSVENLKGVAGDLRQIVSGNRENIDVSLANARKFSQVLADRGPAIAGNLDSLTADLDQMVKENRENLAQSLANLREATAKFSTTLDSVNSTQGTLGRLIHDGALYEDLQAATKELRGVLARLDRGEGTLGKLLTDDSAYAELTGSLQNVQSITDKIDRGEGTMGKLVNDDTLHKNLNDALEGITGFVSGANRFQFELSYRGEFLAQLGEAKNYFGLEVRPRQDRFYYVGLVDDPRGDMKTKTTTRVITDETGTHTVTEEETVTKDKLKFSAQVGQRFSFLTLRGGIFESSGGVGADLDFWSRRLRLTFEAFDFGRDKGPPHLKLSARWMFLNHVFVTAGLDDFIDTEGRSDYFVGGGIRFLDDDLKYLLSPASSLAR